MPDPVTVAEALASAGARLLAAGVDTPELDARVLLQRATDRGEAWLFANPDARVDAEARSALGDLLARRERREPMSHILGEREFWSRSFLVTPAVLTPRPESESVVEAALERLQDRRAPRRILDLGTGSGCLLLTLLAECPNAIGWGIDRSPGALGVAAANAARLGLSGRAHWLAADWCDPVDARFDVVVSNPPYIVRTGMPGLAPEVRDFEPRVALDGGVDGLAAYRRILPAMVRVAAPHAVLVVEVGHGQSRAVEAIARVGGLRLAGTGRDLGRRARALVLEPAENR